MCLARLDGGLDLLVTDMSVGDGESADGDDGKRESGNRGLLHLQIPS